MKIAHIAIWVNDLEQCKDFYCKYFDAASNNRYHNPVKKFSSYFLSFENGCRLELMQRPDIKERTNHFLHPQTGWAHLAFSAGSRENVQALTERLRSDGYTIIGEPRYTGDGYYESVVLDPEENIIEITI